MTSKYKARTPDLIDTVKDLQRRMSKLERTPQLPNSAVDTGQVVVVGEGTSSVSLLSGDQIPDELQSFYTFFSTPVTTAIVNRYDDDTYTYAVTCGVAVQAYGTVFQLGVHESFRYFWDSTFHSVGYFADLFGEGGLTIGSSFFAKSALWLQNASMFLGDLNFPAKVLVNQASAACNSNLTLSTTPTDIANATVTLTTQRANALAQVRGVFDFEETGAGTTVCVGHLVVDGGSAETRQAIFGVAAVGNRASVAQQWPVVLAASGSHTLKLQGSKSIAAGTCLANSVHTTIDVEVFEA